MNLILNGEGVATAAGNPGQILDVCAEHMALLGPGPDAAGYMVTVLKAGAAGDLAAYRALVAVSAYQGDREGAMMWVCKYGHKISAKEAESLFRWSQRGEYRR